MTAGARRHGEAEPGLCLNAEELTNLSHGLRSPLTTMLGYAELLSEAEPPLDPEAARTVDAIQRNAARQCRLLDNLATLADLQMGMIPRVRKPVDVGGLLDRLPAAVAAELAETQTELLLPGMRAQVFVIGDAERLWHAVREVVRNAIEASAPKGRVGVLAGAHSGHASIEVTDTGRGIAAEELAEVLLPFGRTRYDQDNHTQGTGLGLTVANGVIRAHGGELELISTLGRGTRVVLRLPQD